MAVSFKNINSNWLLLGLAVVLGSGAAYLGGTALENRMQELDEQARAGLTLVPVVVAKQDLQRGEPVTATAFAVRKIPKEYVNADAVRPSDFEGYISQRLIVPLRRGDVLMPVHTEGNGNKVFSSTLGVGKRALTFEVDTVNSVSGMLRPGDRIDLIYTARGADEREVTQPLLSNLEILATDQVQTRRDEHTGKERTFSTITMELSPVDAQKVIVAKQAGRLTALLRHPDDKAANATGRMDPGSLLGNVKTAAGTSTGIEYLVGGGGDVADIKMQASRAALNLPVASLGAAGPASPPAAKP